MPKVDWSTKSLLKAQFAGGTFGKSFAGQSVEQILGSAQFTVKDIGFKGKYVSLFVPAKLMFSIQRTQFVARNDTKLTGAINAQVQQFMKTEALPALRAAVAAKIDELIYNTPAKVIRKNARGAWRQVFPKWRKVRTGNLKFAVMRGITYINGELEIGIDASIAPYYVWVEKGHRVVVPQSIKVTGGGYRRVLRDTGTRVMGRSFMREVMLEAKRVFDADILPVLIMFAKDMWSSVGEWTVTGKIEKHVIKSTDFSTSREGFIRSYAG